jgi:cytochrome c
MTLRSISAGTMLALALALAACSGGEPASEEPAVTETPAAAAPEAAASPVAEASAEASPAPEASASPEADKAAAAAAPAKPAAAPAAEVVKVAAVVAPPPAYGRCAVCHTADKGGEDKLGPNLYGAFGSAAGQGKFAYSDALKGAGLKWDEATLHKWLENPKALVPGNRMSFPGIKDAAKRQEIIDYLKQQS